MSKQQQPRAVEVPLTARTALLQALLEGPAVGSELINRVKDRTGGGVNLLGGSVYPALKWLEERKLIMRSERKEPIWTEKGGHSNSVLKLTVAGRKIAMHQRQMLIGLLTAPIEGLKTDTTIPAPPLPDGQDEAAQT